MDRNLVLVVDDDKDIREMIKIMLNNQNIEVLCANDGLEALDLLKNNIIDLIILDVMMPKMDGIVTCMKIRETLNVPIIILSAKIDDTDKILGLTLGADDYLGKPFNPMELIARVNSQLRRFKQLNPNNNMLVSNSKIINIQDLTINIESYMVTAGDKEIKLTPHEFDILVLLSQNRGNVLSIEQIYENVWKETYAQFDRTVTVHIRRLRQKLEKDYIKTVWGVGYKIEG